MTTATRPCHPASVKSTLKRRAPWARDEQAWFSDGKTRSARVTAAIRPRPGSATARRRSAVRRGSISRRRRACQQCRRAVAIRDSPGRGRISRLPESGRSPERRLAACFDSTLRMIADTRRWPGIPGSEGRCGMRRARLPAGGALGPRRISENPLHGVVAARGPARARTAANAPWCGGGQLCVVLQTLRNGVTISTQIDNADRESVTSSLMTSRSVPA